MIRQALRQTQAICAICIKCKLQLRSQITPLRPVCKSAQLKEIEVSEGREILEQKRWHGHSALSILLIISNFCISTLIIYTKKLLNSDWLRKECNSSVTRVQTCNTSANYKRFLIAENTKETTKNQSDLSCFNNKI